jgi:hypothetical protein
MVEASCYTDEDTDVSAFGKYALDEIQNLITLLRCILMNVTVR